MPTVFSTKILSGYEDSLNGVRRIASTRNGRWLATGRLSGMVEVSFDGNVLYETDMRPLSYKANADRFLSQLSFSESGDLLVVASGVDVVAVNSTTGTQAWEFVPARSFGFLKSVPQGLAMTAGDELVVGCSSGEMVKLDRKGRIVVKGSDNDSPQSLVPVAGLPYVFGTDGYSLVAWDTESLKRARKLGTGRRYYALSSASAMPIVAVRTDGAVGIYDVKEDTWVTEIPVGPGLPVTALSPDGGLLAFLQEGRPVLAEVWGGRTRSVDLGVPAVTTSWVYREEKFGFGTADGRVAYLTFDDLGDSSDNEFRDFG